MADAPSLGDFFKSKGKKKIKATNLNKETAAAKPDDQKVKKATEDDAWQEEQIVAQTMKVEVVGKLMRDEEKKDEDDVAAPAWGAAKKDAGSKRTDLTDKKYPSLAKSVASVNIDDGSDNKVNIQTSKNVFAALEGDEEEDEAGTKRPKAINSSMVSKKKGEFEKVALKREVDKYAKKDAKKAKKAEGSEDEEEDEEDEEAEAEEDEDQPEKTAEELLEEEEKRREKKLKKKESKKEVEEDAEEAEDVPEDLRMQPDLKAAKDKYTGRKRLPPVDLPRSEMQEQKENKPVNQQSGGKKKKFSVEEETDKKIAYAAW